MDVTTDNNPYRRNLLLTCTAFLIYHFAEGKPVENVHLGLVGLEISNPDVLFYFAMAFLFWTGYRYWHNSGTNSFNEHIRIYLNNWISRDIEFRQRELKKLTNDLINNKIEAIIGHVERAKLDDIQSGLKIKSISNYNLETKSFLNIELMATVELDKNVQYMSFNNISAVEAQRPFGKLQSFLLLSRVIPKLFFNDEQLTGHTVCTVLFWVTIGVYLGIRPFFT